MNMEQAIIGYLKDLRDKIENETVREFCNKEITRRRKRRLKLIRHRLMLIPWKYWE